MEMAIERSDHFPSLAQLNILAADSGISSLKNWNYKTVANCPNCGGAGWHYVKDFEGRIGVASCDECPAGKNMQLAPKGHNFKTLAKMGGEIAHAGTKDEGFPK